MSENALPPADHTNGDPRFAGARAELIGHLKEKRLPSIAVAVAQGGRIIWEEAFGWANREKGIRATPHTVYSLASLTKSLTATGIMVLAERGRLDLAKPVDDYLGPVKITAYEGRAQDATVLRTLGHKAGFPEYYHFFYETEPVRRPAPDDAVRRYGILVYPPGEVTQYSNAGYGLLDYLISRVSGKTYEDFLRNDVFLPLGMTHSSVGLARGLEEYAAQRYDGEHAPIPFYDFDHRGGSAAFASVHDMVRFGMFFLKDRLAEQTPILKDQTIDQMHREQERCPGSLRYGLGWILEADRRGFRTVGHGGGMPGVSSLLTLIPAEDVAVVVLVNANTDIAVLQDAVLAAVLPKWAEHRKTQVPAPPEQPERPVPQSARGEWEGEVRTFEGALPVKMVFQEDGDIHVKLADQMTTLLNQVHFRDGDILKGEFWGQIETSDTREFPHTTVRVEMLLRGDRLTGWALAKSPRYGLPSWTHLTRKSSAGER